MGGLHILIIQWNGIIRFAHEIASLSYKSRQINRKS